MLKLGTSALESIALISVVIFLYYFLSESTFLLVIFSYLFLFTYSIVKICFVILLWTGYDECLKGGGKSLGAVILFCASINLQFCYLVVLYYKKKKKGLNLWRRLARFYRTKNKMWLLLLELVRDRCGDTSCAIIINNINRYKIFLFLHSAVTMSKPCYYSKLQRKRWYNF